MTGDLAPTCLDEKLAPPRPLVPLGPALYAPPLVPGATAWLAWLGVLDVDVLDVVEARARADGARALTVGGPPGNYVLSGLDPVGDREAVSFFVSQGYGAVASHVDLVVRTRDHCADPEVFRCVEPRGVFAWIERTFSRAWSMEAQRAHRHGGLFVLPAPGGSLQGFVAHSGNRVWEGTFGPVGVVPHGRGHGAGRRLTATALADLAARGHQTAVVPWVEPATVGFYARFCEVLASTSRVLLRRTWEMG
jgi:GNAT superfamily N-acetyltransferase